MPPKVCLITRDLTRFHKAWTQVLRHLGIDYTICVATSGSANATIQTPQGAFAPSSPDLRGYFRQFDAVILCDHARTLSETAVINYSVYWLSWNAPEDPPFLFFNPHFSTAITESAYNSNFPSDFPIVRPNPSNLGGTLYAADGGSPSSGTPLFASYSSGRGACVQFVAENIRAHVMTVCNAHGASPSSNVVPYFWRLNTTQHNTLANTPYTHRVARNGRAGEILAVPAPPTNPDDGETYGADCVVAYRYKNIFWLPHAIPQQPLTLSLWDVHRADVFAPMLFWLLYGLQVAGVRPRYKLPVQIETDHPIESTDNTPPFDFTLKQQMEVLLAKFDYMRDFARRRNTAIINGVRVGGKTRVPSFRSFHWVMLYGTNVPADARAVAQQVNEILVAGHKEGTLPCGYTTIVSARGEATGL
jgi:hypothetical protein